MSGADIGTQRKTDLRKIILAIDVERPHIHCMNTKSTEVTTSEGTTTFLFTDDTFTLAFPDMEESTPATLADVISEPSLREIIRESSDSNEVRKAERAVALLAKR